MSARLINDGTFDTVKQLLKDRLPIIDITKAAPVKGSFAYNAADNKLYFADGVEWTKVVDSSLIDAHFVLTAPDPNFPNASVLTGTPNQVIVTPGPGVEVLSTPQDIAPTSDVTFNSVTFPNTGGGPAAPLNYYEEESLSLPVVGWTSGNMNVKFVRVGKMVVFTWDRTTGTMVNSSVFIQVLVPSQFLPGTLFFGGSGIYFPIDNTTSSSPGISLVFIQATGTVTFTYGPTGTTFPANDSITVREGSMSWIVA